MTNPQVQNQSSASPRIGLPGIAAILFTLSPIMLLLGWMVLMGTSSRGFFSGAPFQATLGTMIILVGAIALLSALVLVGVRVIAQQQLDLLLRERRQPLD